jgi:hypothetical protein
MVIRLRHTGNAPILPPEKHADDFQESQLILQLHPQKKARQYGGPFPKTNVRFSRFAGLVLY